jgi:HD-like signal output (HDOD) protein
VDVVVSDMRMPGMDGAELLVRVRERWPASARIILSGQSDHDAVFRAIGPAHQYLAKPCDIDELAKAIDRLGSSSCPDADEPVRALVGRVDRLPAQPDLFRRLTDQLESPTARLADIAAVIADDPALTAEILRLVNSAFFGTYGTVESVEAAVSLLGVDVVRGVVLGCTLFDAPGGRVGWVDLSALGARSRDVAASARGLAIRRGAVHATGASAFLAGMVAEIGLLVMGGIEVTADVADRLNDGVDLEVETDLFGGHRFQIGAILLSLWGFSPAVVDAVRLLDGGRIGDDDVLGWSVASARRLVIDLGLDAAALADPRIPIPGVDEVLAQLSDGNGAR